MLCSFSEGDKGIKGLKRTATYRKFIMYAHCPMAFPRPTPTRCSNKIVLSTMMNAVAIIRS